MAEIEALVEFCRKQFGLGCRLRVQDKVLRYCFIGVEPKCRKSISGAGALSVQGTETNPQDLRILNTSTADQVSGRLGAPDWECHQSIFQALFNSGPVARARQKGRWALKGRMTLFSAKKGRTKAKTRSQANGESIWK